MKWTKVLAAICALAFVLAGVAPLGAKEKKKEAAPAPSTDPSKPTKKQILEGLDISKIV